ncbi:MAG: hypothetical protein H8E29_04365 [Anaerolineales bacterium]|uniref:Uncharacterized protein n=1 Tax=Candidatus Desulfolinea nitratireducens TaxID=2841698 RepID=A0A8J6NGQ1_9CHLR|nr:hypothetical protein [Candidatus Desulfolinea nitratireducens]
MADIPAELHPVLANASVVSNAGAVTSNTPVENRQEILGTNSPAATAARVAQANPPSGNKMPSDQQILELQFPGEMNNVDILKIKDVPSELVGPEDYQAWTNSDSQIFIKEKPELDEFMRIFVLYHEGIHIRQFNQNGPPKLFQNMIKYEVQAYGKSTGWLDTKQAQRLGSARKDFRKTVQLARQAAANVFRIADAALEQHIMVINDGFTEAEIDEIYLETMIENSMLPDKYVNLEEFKRYQIGDLYKQTGKTFFSE